MRRSTVIRIMLMLPAFILLSGGMVATLRAHRGEEHNADTAQTNIVAPDLQAAQARDSLFAVINEEYTQLRPVFERSCYDCHSKFTHYPWYHKVPLIKSMIDDDIKKGRKHLDFSDGFPFEGHGHIIETLGDIKSEIDERGMPLWSYRLIHWGTAMDGARRDSVFQWLDTTIARITELYVREGLPLPKPKTESSEEE